MGPSILIGFIDDFVARRTLCSLLNKQGDHNFLLGCTNDYCPAGQFLKQTMPRPAAEEAVEPFSPNVLLILARLTGLNSRVGKAL
jgi:hypothetical protein